MALNTINVRGRNVTRTEEKAGGTITPGMLIEFDSSGDVIAHGTDTGIALARFALDEPWSSDSSGSKVIDVTYTSGDLVQTGLFSAGDLIYGFLDSTSADADKGDPLVSSGNGHLKVDSTGNNDDVVVGFAYEDVTSPGSGGARIRVEVR